MSLFASWLLLVTLRHGLVAFRLLLVALKLLLVALRQRLVALKQRLVAFRLLLVALRQRLTALRLLLVALRHRLVALRHRPENVSRRSVFVLRLSFLIINRSENLFTSIFNGQVTCGPSSASAIHCILAGNKKSRPHQAAFFFGDINPNIKKYYCLINLRVTKTELSLSNETK
jgi:hypothetical protein